MPIFVERLRLPILAGALSTLAACEFNQGGPGDPGFLPPTPPPVLGNAPVVRAPQPPPAVSGGTMEIGPDDRWLVAADPDRDLVYAVALGQTMEHVHTIRLERGAEPGRVAFVGDEQAQVVLRSADRLITIDLPEGSIIEDRATCVEPRGVSRDGEQSIVACASGEVWWLRDGDDAPNRIERLRPDLRDVVMTSSGPRVSTFRSAQLLTVEEPRQDEQPEMNLDDGQEAPARIAWRTRALDSGDVLVLHQRAAGRGIEISIEQGGYGPSVERVGGIGCSSGIVSTEVTRVSPDGTVQSLAGLSQGALAVDMAVNPDASEIAVVSASVGTANVGGVTRMSIQGLQNNGSRPRCFFGPSFNNLGSATSVAYAASGRLLALSREPAMITVLDTGERLDLEQPSVADTGHQLFHAVTFAGVACASCHPEGRDDGHVWDFQDIGRRRTQNLTGGIMDTAPFHWNGELPTLGALMGDVFASRMGGGEVDSAQIEALAEWMNSLRPLDQIEPADPDAVEAGRAIFHSAAVGCADCHEGARGTGPGSFFVGTGGFFQVPALENLVYRAPFMHDGCAETLSARFDSACGGGDQHGRTSNLDADQLENLSAYLRSL